MWKGHHSSLEVYERGTFSPPRWTPGWSLPYKTMFKTRSPSPPPSPPTPHQDHELVIRRLIKIITGNSHTFLTEPIASTWAAFVQFPEFFHAFVVAIARTRKYNTNAYRMIHRAFTRQGPGCCDKIQSKPVDNYLLFIGVKREKFVELTKVPHR